eukprot:250619_1
MGYCDFALKPYLKVLFATSISFGGISAIYSFLSKPGELKILAYATKIGIIGQKSYQGIVCEPFGSPMPSPTDCNDVAQQMANNITMNPSWDCQSKLEYSDLFVFENMHFALIFGLLVTFAFIAECCVTVHDWRLIKHRRDLSKTVNIWFPNHDDDTQYDPICSGTCIEPICNYKISDHYHCCLELLFILLVVIMSPVIFGCIIIFYFTLPLYFIFIYPFNCVGANAWRRFKNFDGNLCKISYLWIGLAKFCLLIMTMSLTMYGFAGFSVFIHTSYNPYGDCYCSCHYVFPSTNFYGLMIVTYVLMLKNILFLYQETFESIPNKLEYLMSKTYVAVMNVDSNVFQILKNDPTQSILYKKDDTSMPDEAMNENYGSMSDEAILLRAKDELHTQVNAVAHIDNGNVVESRNCLHCLYGSMFVLSVLLIIAFTTMGFVLLGISNAYNWPHWASQMMMWIGIVGLIICILSTCLLLFKE